MRTCRRYGPTHSVPNTARSFDLDQCLRSCSYEALPTQIDLSSVARPRRFGFAILERAPEDASGLNLTLSAFDTRGNVIARCRIEERRLACD
jgi:hypothetical protein